MSETPDHPTSTPSTVSSTSTQPLGTPSAGDRRLEAGELVLLVDAKARRYLQTLTPAKRFESHTGSVAHDDLIGQPEGTVVATERGQKFTMFRPTLEEFVISMPRGAQVIYPKDLGAILMQGDVGAGTRVFESGLGSGALSMALLRTGASIVGYEIREDFLDRARKNVAAFLGPDALERYETSLRSAYEPLDLDPVDRVVLDLPEPWQVVPHAEAILHPGGLILAYTPSITQVQRFRDALERSRFVQASTIEVLHRGWYVEGQAVRPDHRMVAHTAFLTRARLLG